MRIWWIAELRKLSFSCFRNTPRIKVVMFRMLLAAATGLSMFALASTARGESYESFTEPFRKMELAPAESGVVAEICVKEGAEVHAGDVLASLDKDVLTVSRDIADAAAKAEGRRKGALAEVRLREVRLRKIRELRSNGHASQEEMLRAETELEAAEAQRKIVEEQRELDLLELKKTEALIERRLIRSPIDGVVTKIHHEQGEFVTPISPTVVTVVQIHPLRAVFNLPSTTLTTIKKDAAVRLKLAESDETITGKVEFIAPIIDADSETVRVKVLIDNSHGRILAGSRCFWQFDDQVADDSVANR